MKFENLDVHKLIDAINLLLSPPTLDSARRMSHHMSGEVRDCLPLRPECNKKLINVRTLYGTVFNPFTDIYH